MFLSLSGLENLAFPLFRILLRNEIGIAGVILITRVAARVVVLGFILSITHCFAPKTFPAFDNVDPLAEEPLSILLTSITAISWKLLIIRFILLECASCLLTSITH